ncbi:hypothetical protein RB195_003645 [Necator americanus]|uniref:Uncharacterized protein n=1 Tax=Necator americanus TaxID=51031 RepID=A0ABR1DPH1_NECAM
MALPAFHSHLLFVLLTNYFNLIIFILVSGQNVMSIFAEDTSKKTAAEYEKMFEALKMVVSFSLHCAALLCATICILFVLIENLKNKVSPTVTIVILVFILVFNLIAAILLLIYVPKNEEERSSLAGGTVSIIAALMVFFLVQAQGSIDKKKSPDGKPPSNSNESREYFAPPN